MYRNISTDKASEAYAEAVRRVEDYRAAAKVARRIAKELDGAVVNIRLEKRLQEMFPEYAVRYCRADYAGRKYAAFSRGESRREFADVLLAAKDQQRIDAEQINAQAKHYEEQSEKYSAAVENFYELLGQWNTLAAAMNVIEPKISRVMYCARNFQF